MLLVFIQWHRRAHALLCLLQENFKLEGKVAAGLGLQSPLILHWCADARNQILEAIHGALKIVNIFSKQSKEFSVAHSGHKHPQLQQSSLQFRCQAIRRPLKESKYPIFSLLACLCSTPEVRRLTNSTNPWESVQLRCV